MLARLSTRRIPVSRSVRYQLWIVAAAAVVFFTNLGATGLWDLDEAFYSSCAREMLDRGDLIVPMYNGELSIDKPPLAFWLMMTGFKMFGATEFAARFWSAILAIGTALCTYHLGRLLFRAEVGFWAVIITVSTIIFTVSARAATVDSSLTFFTTLAMLLFVVGWSPRQNQAENADDPSTETAKGAGLAFKTPSWTIFVAIYALLAVAVLAKGPVGVVLPVATIGLFLLIINRPQSAESPRPTTSPERWRAWLLDVASTFSPRNVLETIWQMRPLTAIVVLSVVALPWYLLVALRTDGGWVEQFFAKFTVGAYIKPTLGHRGPFFYHFAVVLIGFFPWSVFLGPTLVHWIRWTRERHAWHVGHVFAGCWIGVWFLFWSICSTKLPHYVLPAYPALALLTGCFLHGWLTEPACVNRWWIRNAAGTLVVVGVGFLVVVPVVTWIFVPGEELLGLVGLTLVVGGGLCFFYLERGRPERVLVAFALTSVIFTTSIFAFAALRIDRHQNAKPLIAEVRKASPEPPEIVSYCYGQASIVFYAHQSVPRYGNIEELAEYLRKSDNPYVFTTNKHEETFEQRFPGEYRVLARRPRFLRSGEVLVLTRRSDSGVSRTAKSKPADIRR